MTKSPPRVRRDGTVVSAEIADASVVSSLRKWEASVSPEKTLFDPFMSLRICAMRLAACWRKAKEEYVDCFPEERVPAGEGSLLEPLSGTARNEGRPRAQRYSGSPTMR